MVPITYVYLDLCGYIIGYPLCMYPPKVCYLSARISTLSRRARARWACVSSSPTHVWGRRKHRPSALARVGTNIHLSRMCIDFVFSQLCYPEKTLGVSFFIFLDCSSLLVQSVDISGVSKNTKNQQTVLQLTTGIILLFLVEGI